VPNYEYKCKKCSKVFEVTQNITSDALDKCIEAICPEEERGEVERLISKTSFSLKGSGWYSDGYS